MASIYYSNINKLEYHTKKYGYIRKKKVEKFAIMHQYELKLSDTASATNEDANRKIGI
jgi:hypothetical protein